MAEKNCTMLPVCGFGLAVDTSGIKTGLSKEEVQAMIDEAISKSPSIPFGGAPIPTLEPGIGQVVNIRDTTNTGFTLPEEGMWFYSVHRVQKVSGNRSQITGIAAGGTKPVVDQFAFGFAWRIA